MTTEQLKEIAEKIGEITEMYEGHLCIQSGETSFSGNPGLIIFNPEINLDQLEMIKKWLRENGYGYEIRYDLFLKTFYIRIVKNLVSWIDENSDESLAFLNAFYQLIQEEDKK